MIHHEPPLPVRMALVSTTTALATPSFPALGFLYAVLRLTVPDADLRKAMEGRWGTLLSFTTWTVLPTLYHGSIASLILPCALSNAVVAGGMYGLIDVASGGPTGQMKQLYNTPILGSGIGASVGYLAPHYVYGPALELYGFEGMKQSISYILSAPLVTEVSVVTGAVAGMILHPLLYYPIHGVSGVHWGYFSGLTLAASAMGMYYVYYGRETVGLPVPEGSFIDAKQFELVNAVLRYNQYTHQVETYSVQSGSFVGSQQKYLEGLQIAEAARMYSKNGNAVFDDRMLSFIYNYWDVKLKSRYADHVLDVKSLNDLNQIQGSLAVTDGIVAALMARSTRTSCDTKLDVQPIIERVDSLRADSKRRRKQFTRSTLEEVCIAVELLMALKNTTDNQDDMKSLVAPELEQFIRKTSPNVILYASEEICPGVSIESQLHAYKWNPTSLDVAYSNWYKLRKKQRENRISTAAVIACAFLSVVALAFGRT
ncbi:hypothetical protein ACHAWO_005922 [Cyclotella atomus]|uniref:Uncharacterized protein n=1 Tax=Cyclotella atomus TaxID=382360 RepID=A0ABD3NKN5_9STRA